MAIRDEPTEPYKRYAIIAFDAYYPGGFDDDIEADADELYEAREYLRDMGYRDTKFIFDFEERRTVSYSDQP